MPGGKPRVPPRWFVVTAWHVHRLILRATGDVRAYEFGEVAHVDLDGLPGLVHSNERNGQHSAWRR